MTEPAAYTDPRELAAPVASSPGIEYFRRIIAGELPPQPIAALVGMRGVEAEPGRAVFELTPGPQHFKRDRDGARWDRADAAVDSAMSSAVHTLLDAGVVYTTLEVKVNFVRAITAETGPIRCEGTVVHGGSRVATAEGQIVDGAGRLLAHGTTTCLILR